MRSARGPYRAVKVPAKAQRGIRECVRELLSDAPVPPERAAAIERELARAPYLAPPQQELDLSK